MKILLIADNGFFSDPFRQLALTRQHDLWVMTTDQSRVEQLQHSQVHVISGNPAENGEWVRYLPPQLDVIINSYLPFQSQKLSYKDLENTYNPILTKISQNISFIAEKTSANHIYQIIPPNFYGQLNPGTVNEKTQPQLTGLAFAYDGLIRHFQGSKIPATFLVSASLLYNSDAAFFPEIPLLFDKLYPIIHHGDNWLSLIHIEDLVGASLHCIENQISEKVVNLVDDKPMMQKDILMLMSKMHNRIHPLPLPATFAHLLFGEAVSDILSASSKIKNDLLKSTGYWFKYPDYQAGLAKFIVNL